MHYDAIIIGSGQAGNPLWDDLTRRGWSAALIEREQLGGTCIIYGCTPTKTIGGVGPGRVLRAGRWPLGRIGILLSRLK